MKRKLLLLISSIFLLSGCGSASANDVANPYEIKVDSETLSIYDDQTKFEENGFKVFHKGINGIDVFDDNDFAASKSYEDDRIVVNNDDNNTISIITIYGENIITYKSISTGDNSSKIEDAFEYEYKLDDDDSCSYVTFFDENGKEIDAKNTTAKAYSISYEVSNSKIQYITICIE